MHGEEVGADNLIEKVLGLQWNSGWMVAAPKAEHSHILSHLALDTLFVPLLVGAGVALVTGATVLGTITCCFMKRLRKR